MADLPKKSSRLKGPPPYGEGAEDHDDTRRLLGLPSLGQMRDQFQSLPKSPPQSQGTDNYNENWNDFGPSEIDRAAGTPGMRFDQRGPPPPLTKPYRFMGPPPDMAPTPSPGAANYMENARPSTGWWDKGAINEDARGTGWEVPPSTVGLAADTAGYELQDNYVRKWGDNFAQTLSPKLGGYPHPEIRPPEPPSQLDALKVLLSRFLSGGK